MLSNKRRAALGIAAAWLLAGNVLAQEPVKVDEDSPVRSIRPVGEDGGTFYVVYCDNGLEGSVSVYKNPPKVCAGPPKECRASWGIVQAAEQICR